MYLNAFCKMISAKIILNRYCLFIVVSALVEASPAQNNYDFPIGGNLSIAECISGKRPKNWDAEMFITTTEMARKLGYRAEDHVVVTEDGYILTLHRIPGRDGASPIFLHHGLLGNSYNFVMAGKNRSLAFILADNGYDVWLGNSRGSIYSMCHTRYTTSEHKFWNFSWHESAVFDAPAQIKYITNITKQDIIFLGYSMGTTVSYVMAIERPDIASKIKVILSLAPVAYLRNLRSPPKLLAPFVRILEILGKVTSGKVTLPPPKVIKYLCFSTLIQKEICKILTFSFFGFDYQQFNTNVFPTLSYHLSTPSLKSFNHYFHEKNSGRFMYYDYGRKGNLRMYNSTEAPDYDISKINVPVGIFWGENDYVAVPKDVQKFYKQLPNKILNYRVKSPKFSHIDFILSIDSPKYVYAKLLSVMESYR